MWYETAIPLLRALIDDLGSPSTYSDSRLEELLVYAAFFINRQVDFDQTYTIDVTTTSISPSPDKDFINLMVLKAATIIFRGEVKVAASEAFRVVDGPSSVDTSLSYEAKKKLADIMEDDLAKAILQYQLGNSNAGKAIITPYTQPNINIRTFY